MVDALWLRGCVNRAGLKSHSQVRAGNLPLHGDGEVDITEFDITESDVTFFQEIDITEFDVTKKGN